MATTYTEYYNLGMQENHSDRFDMNVITENMKKIDQLLHSKLDSENNRNLLLTIGERPEAFEHTQLWMFIPNFKRRFDTIGERPDSVAEDVWTYMLALEARIAALEAQLNSGGGE